MKNKKIVFILLLLVLLVSFCITCNAEDNVNNLMKFNCNTSDTSYSGKDIYYPDVGYDLTNRQYVIFISQDVLYLYFGFTDNTEYILYDESSDMSKLKAVQSLDNTDTLRCKAFMVDIRDVDITNPESVANSHLEDFWSHDFADFSFGQIVSTNMNVYDNSGKLFFPKTPQGIVAQQVEEVEMSQVMMEMVGLVPLVIGFLVLVIGLRKGLAVLLRILRAS